MREQTSVSNGLISIMIARILTRKGCEAFLVYVEDTKKREKELMDILIVREYPYVFLD